MNLELIIQSGFLELYVLNQLSPEEMAAIDKLCLEFPEIKTKIKEIEKTLEEYSIDDSQIDIPNSNLDKIKEKLGFETNNILDLEPTKEEVDHQIGEIVFEVIPSEDVPIEDEISLEEENKWAPNFNKNSNDEISTEVLTDNIQESINISEVIAKTEPAINDEIEVLEERIVHDATPINVPDLTQSTLPNQSSDMKFKFLSIAASLIAVLFGAASFYFYNKYEIASKQLSRLEIENKKHIEQYSLASNELSARDVELKILNDVDFKKVVLSTTDTAVERAATIFWNNKTGKVYANTSKLPTLSSNQQYQLWAIKAGKPVDLGVITDTTTSLTSQNDIDKAEAFAITVEKTGGNATPTMEKMVVKAAI